MPSLGDCGRSQVDTVDSLWNLSFARGSRHCLHVPGIRNALTVAFTIATASDRDLFPVHTATVPKRESWFRRKFRPTTPVGWLAARTDCTDREASERLASLPVSIPDRFDCMGLNPLRFLGFLVALHGDPRVIVYETAGMDPRGVSLLHSFAESHYTTGTLVHRCSTPLDGCTLASDCTLIDW